MSTFLLVIETNDIYGLLLVSSKSPLLLVTFMHMYYGLVRSQTNT